MGRSSGDLVHQHPASRRARQEAGRARRRDVALDDLAALPDVEARRDPIEVLTKQDERRLQSLVPIRHGRMSATPFTFYRGAAAVMASDLSQTPSTDLGVQLCGDAHLANFGLFSGPDRRLVFDLNDFDETHPGPFEWDVKRLAASVAVAGRNNELSPGKVERAVLSAVEGYRTALEQVVERSPLEVHYWRLELDQLRDLIDDDGKAASRLDKATRKATRKNSLRALDKLTDIVDGRRVIVSEPPLIERLDQFLEPTEAPRLDEFFDRYIASLPRYRRLLLDRYAIVDIAHKVVGVGSVGTRCLIVLLESGDGEPLFLQFKEATDSVLEPYTKPSEFEPGQRVVEGQRLTQTMGDIFLGWSQYTNDDGETMYFYFRQLWDGKGSAEIEEMGGKRLRRYARLCGGVLALSHARSGDASMIAGYIGQDETFDRAVASFANDYADLTERDHAAHLDGISNGRVAAEQDLR
ncbi:MAG: DUF2252 domain-containing protein [Acidimicrobiia bacterium]|nr:DUF2252 domain-containing protein [Acidimicrobiia bacterium]